MKAAVVCSTASAVTRYVSPDMLSLNPKIDPAPTTSSNWFWLFPAGNNT